jgi:hypothetical protein
MAQHQQPRAQHPLAQPPMTQDSITKHPMAQQPMAQLPNAPYPLDYPGRKPNPNWAAQVRLAGLRNPGYSNPWAEPPRSIYLPPNRSHPMNDSGSRPLYGVQAAAQAYNAYSARFGQQAPPPADQPVCPTAVRRQFHRYRHRHPIDTALNIAQQLKSAHAWGIIGRVNVTLSVLKSCSEV